VTALAAAPSPVLTSFELAHVSVDGVEHRVPLSEAWAVPFETGRAGPAVRGPDGPASPERSVVVVDRRCACRFRVLARAGRVDTFGF